MTIHINSYNKEAYINSINDSLDRYISMFEQEGINKEYHNYVPLAKHLKENLNNICLHVHNACYPVSNIGQKLYAMSIFYCLNKYKSFCYNNHINNPADNFLTYQQQNEKTRKYVHYDFSVERIETLETISSHQQII